MMMLKLLSLTSFLALFVSYTIAQQTHSSPIITSNSGPIRGFLLTVPVRDSTTNTTKNLTVYQFSGIPFAEPPIGDRRYRKPTPVKPWNDTAILDATRIPNPCIQSGNFVNSEDCLYLNIWVPNEFLDSFVNGISDELLSTYVYIHGGAFIAGSAYDGSILSAENNIIVASIQYRLGSLGFSYFGTEDVSGNMGLWDQLEALKWVYENIGSFGGNKSEITIGGQSAGAASVTFHLLSPYSRKYFQRAIIESGSALSPWAIHTPQQAITVTNMVVQAASVSGDQAAGNLLSNASTCDKTKYLKLLDAAIFPRADQKPAISGFGIPFAPVIDGDFVPRDPYDMVRVGDFYKVPLLIGATKDEGAMYLAKTRTAMQLLPLPQSPNRTIDNSLNMTYYRVMVEDAFRTFYGGLQPINQLLLQVTELVYWPQSHTGYPRGAEVVQILTQIVGDNGLLCPTYAWAQEFVTFSNVYAYFFTQRRFGETNPAWMGVTHSAEVPFVFGNPLRPSPLYSLEDVSLSLIMMTYWGNFVKYGNPNGIDEVPVDSSYAGKQTWPTLLSNATCTNRIMEINAAKQLDATGDATICGLKARECEFWQDFYRNFLDVFSEESSTTAPSKP